MIKVSMLSEQFRNALQLASPALDPKGVMAVLGSYLVEADNDEVRVSAMNLSLGVRMTIGATVEAGGREVYSGQTLADWTSKIADGDMSIQRGEKSTEFRSGPSRLTMNPIDANEFPDIPSWNECTALASVDADDLVHLLKSVVISCALDEGRPVLECVLIRFMADKLVVAAADGFRMSYLERPGTYETEEGKADYIVPRKSVMALVRLIEAHKPTTVDFAIPENKSRIMARFGPAEWVSGTVDGVFPNVAQIVPKTHADTHHSIRFQADSISRALAPLVGLSRHNTGVVTFEIEGPQDELTPGRIHIEATAAEMGSGETSVDAIISLGKQPDRVFKVDGRYIADVLGVLKGQEVELSVAGSNSALLFRPTSVGDREQHAQVVMPMV